MGWLDVLPKTTQQGLTSTLQKGASGSFWQTPAAAALIQGGLSGVGGLFSGMGQNKSQEAQLQQSLQDRQAERDQQQRQFEAEMAWKQQQAAMEEQLSRDTLRQQSTQLDPLAQQKSRQQNALRNAIVMNAQNFQAPAGMEGFVPDGGLKIPAGGWDSNIQQLMAPAASLAAEQQFSGNVGQSPDMSPFYAQAQQAAPTSTAAQPSWYESNLAKAKGSNAALSAALGGESTIEKTRNRKWLGSATKLAQNLRSQGRS